MGAWDWVACMSRMPKKKTPSWDAGTSFRDSMEAEDRLEEFSKAVTVVQNEKVTRELHTQFRQLASHEVSGAKGAKIMKYNREIEWKVFKDALQNVSTNDLQKEAIDKFMQDGDQDGDGKINFMEFVVLYQKLCDSRELQDLGFKFGAFRGFRKEKKLSGIELFRRYYFSWQYQLCYMLVMLYTMYMLVRIINLKGEHDKKWKQGEAMVKFKEIGYTYDASKPSNKHVETWLLAVCSLSYWLRILTAQWHIMFSNVGNFIILQTHFIFGLMICMIVFRDRGYVDRFIFHMFPKHGGSYDDDNIDFAEYHFPQCNALYYHLSDRRTEFGPAGSRFCQKLGYVQAVLQLICLGAVAIQFFNDFGLIFRSLVSQNKERYVDTLAEFDLDLTFITDELIAMGVPVEFKPLSLSLQHLWRNPAWEVRRFFDDGRPNTYYRIYNLCAEMPYSFELFHNRVRLFDMQDHARPAMSQVFDALRDMNHFMLLEPDKNMVAVHCKAGKGRTGTLCCSWMLYNRTAHSAKEALEIFMEKRTDILKSKIGKKKMIAVDTFSQVQCVYCVDAWLRICGSYQNTDIPPTKPPVLGMNIKSITLQSIIDRQGTEEEGQPLGTVICEIQSPAWDHGAGPILDEAEAVVSAEGYANFKFEKAKVREEFRISVYLERVRKSKEDGFKRPNIKDGPVSKRKKAGHEKGCLFYIFGHTAFYSPDNEHEHEYTELGATKLMKKVQISKEAKLIIEYELDPLKTITNDEDRSRMEKLRESDFFTNLKTVNKEVQGTLGKGVKCYNFFMYLHVCMYVCMFRP